MRSEVWKRDLARAAGAGSIDPGLLPLCLDFLVFDALARRAFAAALAQRCPGAQLVPAAGDACDGALALAREL